MPHLRRPLTASPAAAGEDTCADQHTQAVLELPQVLEAIASLAQSQPGARLVRSLRPCNDPHTVARRQRRLDQLRQLLQDSSPPGLDGLEETPTLFSRLAVEGAFLTCEELQSLAAFLSSVGRAASFLDTAAPEHDELQRLRNRITPLPELIQRISQVVGPGGSVQSRASSTLAGLRRQLNTNRQRLRSRLEQLVKRGDLAGAFSDQVVTQRGDRFVLPVRTEAKGKIKGIIHDTSGSGATCFVEPLETVEDNNRLALLRRREREEEERILRELASRLRGQLQAMRENHQALAQLDCLLAQAAFAERLHAISPELDPQGRLELLKARHPLLAWRSLAGKGKVVPIEVRLEDPTRVLVISGANAGGKTATIKTVGLICLMTLCGLAVPVAAGSRVPVFQRLFCEIGDEQDLGRELSTFTAHAGRLAWICRRAGEGSLVLVDELGGGTDPSEGAALGMAVLEHLMAKGARVLCTTHFHRLKAFAALTDGVQNVSVAFDHQTGRPTYQLHYGEPGFSDALAVSRGLGFDPELIARAKELLDQGERQTVELLRQARRDRQQAARELDQARAERLAAQQERDRARRLLQAARQERAGALAEGKRRVREVARRLEEQLSGLVERARRADERGEKLKPGSLRQQVYQARRQALEEVQRSVQQSPLDRELGRDQRRAGRQQALRAGRKVRVLSLNQTGTLLDDPRPGQETVPVALGRTGVRFMAPVQDLEPAGGGGGGGGGSEKAPRRGGVSVLAQADDGLDLKVVGLTVDEALPLVDKALDQAILAGRNRIRIVHGIGTGRLGRAVRDYLNHHPYVTHAGPDTSRRGGAGVTVAELRD